MLLVITPPSTTAQELETVPKLFDAGLRLLHVRKPGASALEVRDYIAAVPKKYRSRLVLHQHHQLASAGLRGVHYPERDLPQASVVAPPGLTVSLALHQLHQLTVCRGQVDYCLLSPIFPSVSKAGYLPTAELTDRGALSGGVLTSRIPVVALGGVTAARFPQLADWGFAGAALLGAIWEADHPAVALEEALEASKATAWNDAGLSCVK